MSWFIHGRVQELPGRHLSLAKDGEEEAENVELAQRRQRKVYPLGEGTVLHASKAVRIENIHSIHSILDVSLPRE